MSASKSPRTRKVLGFSLIEMMVALTFTSILMTGMFKVFAATTSNFAASTESMSVQRKARWGLTVLQEDVLTAGYLFPVRPAPGGMLFGPDVQPPLMFQRTDYTPAGGTARADELQFVMDVPITNGSLAEALAPGADTLIANVPNGAGSIQVGDTIMLLGAQYAAMKVIAAPGTDTANVKIQFETNSSQSFDARGFPVEGNASVGVINTQPKGIPFTVIRPAQVVRYAVVPRGLDPSNPLTQVPCLVRQMTGINPGTIWNPPSDTPQPGEQILLENVVGFSVNLSVDRGTTWVRDTNLAPSRWVNIFANIQTGLLGSASPFITKNFGPQIPMWTLYAPGLLIRIDLTTRSEVQRTEYSATSTADTPVAAYRLRKETLMLSPRNFGVGIY